MRSPSTTRSSRSRVGGSPSSSGNVTSPLAASSHDLSSTWRQLMLPVPANDTSSPASAPGPTRSASLALPTTPTSGPVPAPASRSATPGGAAGSTTLATSGPRGSASSRSADLQSSLANRLRAALDSRGSILFALTWKERTTPSGLQICALRASVLRTCDSACTSWPTPVTSRGDYTFFRLSQDLAAVHDAPSTDHVSVVRRRGVIQLFQLSAQAWTPERARRVAAMLLRAADLVEAETADLLRRAGELP
jgi:hypothetical protein